jgi:hypothetical protein
MGFAIRAGGRLGAGAGPFECAVAPWGCEWGSRPSGGALGLVGVFGLAACVSVGPLWTFQVAGRGFCMWVTVRIRRLML